MQRKQQNRIYKVDVFNALVVGKCCCSVCGKLVQHIQNMVDWQRFRKSGTVFCSKKCSMSWPRMGKGFVSKWVEENQNKHKCQVCQKFIKIAPSHRNGIPKTCGQKACVSNFMKTRQPSKYEAVLKRLVYCQCPECKILGECEETKIDLSVYTSRQLSHNPKRVGRKLTYKSGHNEFGVTVYKNCIVCGIKYLVSKQRRLHVAGVCGKVCGWKIGLRKERIKRKPLLNKKISNLLNGEVDIVTKIKYSMGQPNGKIVKVYVPLYCKGCGKTKFVTPSVLYHRRIKKNGNESQMLCMWCAPLGQKRSFCWCGLERRKVTKNLRKKGMGKFCKHHAYVNKRYKRITKELKMLVKGMSQKEVVKVLVEKIHLILAKQRDNETELTMCLIELEKLDAEKYFDVYSTFGELIEGEFGWTEIKFKSAKNMMLSYGAERFREYGRETLQCLSRLNDKSQGDLFLKLQEYKMKRNKSPSYGTAATWVREAGGKVHDNETGSKVVNIKKKYLEALEEIKNLNKIVREQSEEIARLNVYIKGKIV